MFLSHAIVLHDGKADAARWLSRSCVLFQVFGSWFLAPVPSKGYIDTNPTNLPQFC